MKRPSFLLLIAAISVMFVSGCKPKINPDIPHKGNEKKIQPEVPEVLPKVYEGPKAVGECNADELALIRQMAKDNGMEVDFANDDPSKWNYDKLPITWKNISQDATKKQFVVVAMGQVDKASSSEIKKFVFPSEATKTFSHLESINLVLPMAEEINVRYLPKLQSLKLNGTDAKAQSKASQIAVIAFSELNALKTLALENFPKLISNDKDNPNSGLQIDAYWQYKKLEDITIKNLPQVINLGVDVDSEVKKFHMSGLEKLSQFKTGVKINFDFSEIKGEDFKNVEKLTLRKIKTSSKTLILENLSKLSYFELAGSEVESFIIRNCPEIADLTIEKCSLKTLKVEGTMAKIKILDLQNNQLETLDLKDFPVLKNLKLNDNNFTEIQASLIPKTVEILNLHGNEKLVSVDLSKVEKLTLLNINGYAREKTIIDNKKPLILNDLKFGKHESLERILCENNSLSILFDGSQKYDRLDELEMNWNEFGVKALVNILKALSKHNNKVSDQRPFALSPVNDVIDYSAEAKWLKDTENATLKVKLFDAATGEEATGKSTFVEGKLTINMAGKYYLSIDDSSWNGIFSYLTTLKSKPFEVKK